MTLDQLYRQLCEGLNGLDHVVPAQDARWIIEEVAGLSTSQQLVTPDTVLSDQKLEQAQSILQRMLAGQSLGRAIGVAEFYGRQFGLNEATLEPRNDTEALVDLVLDTCPDGPLSVLDLGTGTGCILLTLLAERPKWQGVGTDISVRALQASQANAQALRVDSRALFRVGSWFQALDSMRLAKPFDLIVSNPPYLRRDEMGDLSPTVSEHDPHVALVAGEDGLDAYRTILGGAARWLNPDGRLAVEIGAGQAGAVEALGNQNGFELCGSRADLGGHTRALMFVK